MLPSFSIKDEQRVADDVDEVDVVVDDHRRFLIALHGAAYRLRSLHPSICVEMCARLIKQIEVGILSKTNRDTDSLQLTTREFLRVQFKQLIDLQRPNYLSMEFAAAPASSKLGIEPILDAAIEVGGDVLLFVRDRCIHRAPAHVGLDLTSNHSHHGRLAGCIWPDDSDDFGAANFALAGFEVEFAQCLLHVAPLQDG